MVYGRLPVGFRWGDVYDIWRAAARRHPEEALLDFVSNGKAWMGAHSAGATNYTWPGYGELLGGYYETAGSNNRVQILKVEDQDHPATGFLGLFWPLAAEIYTIGQEVWDPSRPDENRNSFDTPIPVAFSR